MNLATVELKIADMPIELVESSHGKMILATVTTYLNLLTLTVQYKKFRIYIFWSIGFCKQLVVTLLKI